MRAFAEKVATGVPNVQQVVNNLQVNNQKATSDNSNSRRSRDR